MTPKPAANQWRREGWTYCNRGMRWKDEQTVISEVITTLRCRVLIHGIYSALRWANLRPAKHNWSTLLHDKKSQSSSAGSVWEVLSIRLCVQSQTEIHVFFVDDIKAAYIALDEKWHQTFLNSKLPNIETFQLSRFLKIHSGNNHEVFYHSVCPFISS